MLVCSDLIARFREPASRFENREVQFLLAGYSWLTNDFRIWTIEYSSKKGKFTDHEAHSFHDRLRKAAFIGDRATALRSVVMRELQRSTGPHWYLEPLRLLAEMLGAATPEDTIGGPPQVVRVAKHMNTRAFCVRWEGQNTLFGRPLFPYESIDYWVIDPLRCSITRPEMFGRRNSEPDEAAATTPPSDP